MSETELQEIDEGRKAKEIVKKTEELEVEDQEEPEPEEREELGTGEQEESEELGTEQEELEGKAKEEEKDKGEELEGKEKEGKEKEEPEGKEKESIEFGQKDILDAEDQTGKKEDEQGDFLQKVPDKILSEDLIKDCISTVHRIGNGLAYAFTQINLANKKLTDIQILEKYIHLRKVDISNNYLTDLKPLNFLNDLLSLTAGKNYIKTLALDSRPYLQQISVNDNEIEEISEGLQHPLIRYIDLNNNKIRDLAVFEKSQFLHLTTLKLEGNRIENINRIDIPSLKTLHLGYNKITSLQWISNLVNLEEVKLNNNGISKLCGFNCAMKNMNYLDLKDNKIEYLSELRSLSCLPFLKYFVLSANTK